jgi:hypothetical protein
MKSVGLSETGHTPRLDCDVHQDESMDRAAKLCRLPHRARRGPC